MDTIAGLRENASGQATIELTCSGEPPAGVGDIDGVSDVTVEGAKLTARCRDPATKVDVVRYVDERATVVDILAENTSLEELFNEYTGGGRDGEAPEGQGVSA
jgi:ABC-2 type transport system ATP-binding protein